MEYFVDTLGLQNRPINLSVNANDYIHNDSTDCIARSMFFFWRLAGTSAGDVDKTTIWDFGWGEGVLRGMG